MSFDTAGRIAWMKQEAQKRLLLLRSQLVVTQLRQVIGRSTAEIEQRGLLGA